MYLGGDKESVLCWKKAGRRAGLSLLLERKKKHDHPFQNRGRVVEVLLSPSSPLMGKKEEVVRARFSNRERGGGKGLCKASSSVPFKEGSYSLAREKRLSLSRERGKGECPFPGREGRRWKVWDVCSSSRRGGGKKGE